MAAGWRASRWRRVQIAAIVGVGVPVVEALGATWTWRTVGDEHVRALERLGQAPILALWHGRILAATLYFRDRGVVAMTSENFDGEWVARLMRRFGYRAARGSTSRGGSRALVQLRRALAAGSPVAFTVDGPRGPQGVAQPGAAWLAGATGHPVLPFHIEADRYWTLDSWDRHQVPKPGATVALALGTPIRMPARPTDADLDAGRRAIETALNALRRQAIDLLPQPHATAGIALDLAQVQTAGTRGAEER